MYSPAWGMCWQIWRRHRWGLLADVLWLAFLAAAVQLLPQAWREPRTVRALGLLSGGVFLHLMAVMTYGLEIELTASPSGFPARMFTLPVSTRTLVAWPMALGALAMAGAWLMVDLAVLRPCGEAAPLALPAAIAAAALMVIQAVAWAPFEFGWARTILLAALAVALVTATVVARKMGASNELLLGGYLALLPALYAAAVAGVACARRGDAYPWPWLQTVVRIVSRLAPHRRQAFASPADAQLWFECRRHAAHLPLFTGLILIELGIALALMAINEADRTTAARLGRVGAVALPVILAAGMAAVVGPGLGKHDHLAKRYEAPPFHAARPIADRDFVAAKFKMAAVSSLLAWALAYLLPVIWIIAPGNYARLADVLSELTQGVPGWKLALAAAAAIVIPPIFIWKQMVQGMYVGLTGHAWVVRVYGYAYGALFPTVLVFGGWAVFWMPEYRPFAWRMAPWLIAAALAVKAILAPLAWRALVRRGIVPTGTLQKWLAFWCAAVAALTGLIVGIAPAGAISFGAALAAAIFLVPFNRLAVAPLAWNWNRHR